MFAVTGITGKVGAAVARSLLSADQPVRAVVRDRSKGAPWARLGCEIAVADLSDTASLTAVFAGTAGVFAMIPPVFDPTPGFPEAMGFINPLRAALARAKPAKVVALSTVGADAAQPNLLNALGRMERCPRGSPDAGGIPARGLVHGQRRVGHRLSEEWADPELPSAARPSCTDGLD